MSNRLGPRTRLLGSGASARVSQWLQRSQVKSVQRATIAITGATSNTATITAVVLANSRLRFLGTSSTANSTIGQAAPRLAFTNTTTITASVDTSPGADTTSVSFEVIEYWPGVIKSVQRGTITGITTATITAVNVNKSEVDWLGYQVTSAIASFIAGTTVTLTDSTTVTTASGSAAAQVTGYQVVEWF